MVFAALLMLAGAEPPPADLVPTGQESAYADWLRADFIARETLFSREPACVEAVVEPVRTERAAPAQTADYVGAFYYERARVTGCGRSSLQNVIVGQLAAGGWRSAVMMPGESKTDIVLLNDVFKSLRPAVTASAPGCDKVVWGEVRSEPYRKDGSWTEVWPISACGQDRTVEISFTPSPRGGTDFAVKQIPLSK